MKKIINLTSLLCIICLLCGCSKTVEKKQTREYSDIEVSNIENDRSLMDSAKNVYVTNEKKATDNTKKRVAAIKYYDDVYKIASNRVNLDLEILGAFSDEYVEYIATCQAYSEVYLKERDKLIDSDNQSNEDIKKNDTQKLLATLQETMENFIKK